jgi:hypothetical protein
MEPITRTVVPPGRELSVRTRLTAYAAVLAVVFALGLGLGRVVGAGDADDNPSTTVVRHDGGHDSEHGTGR